MGSRPAEELEVDAERVERIADLVGDAGGEQPHGLHALGLDERGLVLALARDVAEDGHDARAGALGPLLHRHGVHLQDAPLRAGDLDLARGELRPFAFLAPRQALPVHVGHVARDGAPPHAGDLEAEQRLRGVVRIEEPAVRGYDDDALLDRLEDRLQQPALAHEIQELRLEVFGIQTIHPGYQLVEKSTLRRHAVNSNGGTQVRLIGPQSSQFVPPRQVHGVRQHRCRTQGVRTQGSGLTSRARPLVFSLIWPRTRKTARSEIAPS
jgi:hypothetical protein